MAVHSAVAGNGVQDVHCTRAAVEVPTWHNPPSPPQLGAELSKLALHCGGYLYAALAQMQQMRSLNWGRHGCGHPPFDHCGAKA